MKHIAFITGPADFLNLYSYLQHYKMEREAVAIVLYGTARNISEGLKVATAKLSGSLDNSSYYFQDADEGIDGLCSLKLKIGLIEKGLKSLFMTHVFGKYENLVLDTFSYDRLILIENGLATYYPPTGRDPRLKQDYYSTEPRKYVHEAWLPLAQFIGNPFYLTSDVVKSPSVQEFRSSTADLLARTGLVPSSVEVCKKIVFIAGTSLYRLGVISQEREIECYQQFVNQIVETDVDRIYWKPHPRMSVSSGTVSSISTKVITLTDLMPLEFQFLQKKSEHMTCASIASSTLLFGQHIYDVKPILISEQLKKVFSFPHLINVKYLVNS
jgi:hypothetical protein